PDRNPVKLSISVMPDLHEALIAYAAAYAQSYGREEPITLSGQSAPCLTHH
ncbi:DUF2274 domain-containing protein, partial [Klebsiella pneumoniae]|uniref:DUF2274 domain-containing protein n=1 Tax=Klebsiella pneumoniae TaxID=573 RepID=UPI003B985576